MRRELWRLTISSKRFYVGTFRFAGGALLFSLMLSVLLGVGIFYAYLHMPDRHYYATNGAVPPSELTSMDAPDETSVPLLPPDPTGDEGLKRIPK